MNTKSFVFGLLLGGMTAVIGTLLTAPSPGKEVRKAMKENTDELLYQFTEAKENLHELSQALKSASIEGIDTIKNFISELNISISDWKKEIQPHQLQLQKELSSIEQSVQKLEAELMNKTDESHYRA